MSEFYWARQRAKRVLLFWVVAVLMFTGLSQSPRGRSAAISAA